MLHQMAALDTLAQLQANLPVLSVVFSPAELRSFIEAAYTKNAERLAVLVQVGVK